MAVTSHSLMRPNCEVDRKDLEDVDQAHLAGYNGVRENYFRDIEI